MSGGDNFKPTFLREVLRVVSWLEKSTKMVAAMREKSCAVDITINGLPCKATVGRGQFTSTDGYGVTIYETTTDFIVSAELLGRSPSKEDVITYNGMEYMVVSPGTEPAWRWSDNFRAAYRIHTKEVG